MLHLAAELRAVAESAHAGEDVSEKKIHVIVCVLISHMGSM